METQRAYARFHFPDPGRINAQPAVECCALDLGKLVVGHRGQVDVAPIGQGRDGVELHRSSADGRLTCETIGGAWWGERDDSDRGERE
jgi:hypothetical protein